MICHGIWIWRHRSDGDLQIWLGSLESECCIRHSYGSAWLCYCRKASLEVLQTYAMYAKMSNVEGWWSHSYLFFIFHHIWDNPSHWLSYFSRWLLHHQPVMVSISIRTCCHPSDLTLAWLDRSSGAAKLCKAGLGPGFCRWIAAWLVGQRPQVWWGAILTTSRDHFSWYW